MFNIHTLDNSVIDLIYHFLGNSKIERAFGSTCKRFHTIFCENKKYTALANFVFKNYEVCATNMPDSPTWIALKNVSVILIGETHVQPMHRLAFAQFISLIWNPQHFFILTEETAPQFGQKGTALEYITEKTVKNAYGSWDLDVTQEPDFKKYILCLTEILDLCKAFLHLRDAALPQLLGKMKENWSLIKDSLQAVQQKEKIEELLNLATHAWNENKLFAFSLFQTQITHELALISCNRICYHIKEKNKIDVIDRNLVPRDQEMIRKIQDVLQRLKKRAIVIAGSYHVRVRENSPVKILEKENISFISLLPLSEGEYSAEIPENESEVSHSHTIREKLKNMKTEEFSTTRDLFFYLSLDPLEVLRCEVCQFQIEYSNKMREFITKSQQPDEEGLEACAGLKIIFS